MKIEISLAPEGRTRAAAQKFLNVVKGDLPRLVGDKSSKTKATAILAGDVQGELELVAHRLAAQVEVDDATLKAADSRPSSTI